MILNSLIIEIVFIVFSASLFVKMIILLKTILHVIMKKIEKVDFKSSSQKLI